VTLFTTAGNKGKLTATTIGNIVDPANVSGKGTRIALCPGTSVSVNIHDASGTPHVTPLTPGMTCDPISVGQEATCRVLSLVRTEKLLAESNDGTDKLRMSYLPKK
jgi:hypothetical protein